jgi:hypothetical protein
MVTDEQKKHPLELGDTGFLDRICPEDINQDSEVDIKPKNKNRFITWLKYIFNITDLVEDIEIPKINNVFKHKCQRCGYVYPRLPSKNEFRFDCGTKGCYWMIFSDGSQTYDSPGE